MESESINDTLLNIDEKENTFNATVTPPNLFKFSSALSCTAEMKSYFKNFREENRLAKQLYDLLNDEDDEAEVEGMEKMAAVDDKASSSGTTTNVDNLEGAPRKRPRRSSLKKCNHTNVSPSKCAKRRLIYVPETPEEKLREAKAFPIDNEEIIKQTPIGKIRVDNRARHAKLAHLLKIEEESRRLDTSASSSGTISSNRRRRSKECLSASKSGSPKKHTAKRRLVMK